MRNSTRSSTVLRVAVFVPFEVVVQDVDLRGRSGEHGPGRLVDGEVAVLVLEQSGLDLQPQWSVGGRPEPDRTDLHHAAADARADFGYTGPPFDRLDAGTVGDGVVE